MRAAEFAGMYFLRVRNSKIVEGWNSFRESRSSGSIYKRASLSPLPDLLGGKTRLLQPPPPGPM